MLWRANGLRRPLGQRFQSVHFLLKQYYSVSEHIRRKDTIFRLASWFPSRPINVSIPDVSGTKRGHYSLVDTDSIRTVLTAMMPTLRRRTNEADDVDQQSFAPEGKTCHSMNNAYFKLKKGLVHKHGNCKGHEGGSS